jgi:hypothetical protein
MAFSYEIFQSRNIILLPGLDLSQHQWNELHHRMDAVSADPHYGTAMNGTFSSTMNRVGKPGKATADKKHGIDFGNEEQRHKNQNPDPTVDFSIDQQYSAPFRSIVG